jgi:hypothetical protein
MKKTLKILSFGKTLENHWWSRIIKVITYGGTIVVFGMALFFFFDNFYQLSTSKCVQFEKIQVDNSASYDTNRMFNIKVLGYDGKPLPPVYTKEVCSKYIDFIDWVYVFRNTAFVLFSPIIFFLFMRFGLYESIAYIILGNKK